MNKLSRALLFPIFQAKSQNKDEAAIKIQRVQSTYSIQIYSSFISTKQIYHLYK